MSFDLFFNFDGNCREAAAFYAKVFRSEVKDLMTYGETHPEEGFEIQEFDKKRIMYACVPILGCNVMFMDMLSYMPLVKGNNINPTLGISDQDEIRRLFDELRQNGEVGMDLQKTFWSDLYGMVTDQYGITWHLVYESGTN